MHLLLVYSFCDQSIHVPQFLFEYQHSGYGCDLLTSRTTVLVDGKFLRMFQTENLFLKKTGLSSSELQGQLEYSCMVYLNTLSQQAENLFFPLFLIVAKCYM